MAIQAQDWMEIGGVCEFFEPMIEQPLQRSNPNLGFANQMSSVAAGASFYCNICPPPMTLSHSLASQLERQKVEIGRFIALQNEKLITSLQQKRKEQLLSLIRRLESKATALLQQKEEDILRIRQRTVELEEYLTKAQIENETWQRIARENEAMVLALNNTLEQARESACSSSSADDAESCCDSSWPALGSSQRKGREDIDEKMACKACNSRPSCVLLLPCRHLCSCKSCEAFLDLCPICKSAKKASIEVFI
ncbi:probable BOI-related E3 ubiquitin-protein ligase 3 [Aristolochia californica]|uniref:probable BOI-related E3 ubiquitin-protein ligase 3 n=1 Tax=Aristolochia californica TaxID=171875 RepID=UPI0035E26A2D